VGTFISPASPRKIIQSFPLSEIRFVKNDNTLRCQVRPDQAGHLLHPIQPDIPGLDEIADDSDGGDDFEDSVCTEECTELQEELNPGEPNKFSSFALISLFPPLTNSFSTIRAIHARTELKKVGHYMVLELLEGFGINHISLSGCQQWIATPKDL
jgi:hypothetical protein